MYKFHLLFFSSPRAPHKAHMGLIMPNMKPNKNTKGKNMMQNNISPQCPESEIAMKR